MPSFPSPYEKKLPNEIQFDKIPVDHKKDEIVKQVIGSLVGLAIGDALGASVEFRPREYLLANRVDKMQGGGTWGLEAGKWTDDTSMALCLAASLINENGFNPYDQLVRYKWWYKHGYFSSTGHCFDIGQATRQSITEFSLRQRILKTLYRCRNEYEVDTLALDSIERIKNFHIDCGDQDSAGNGALMRLAPVPLYYFKTPETAIEYAARSCSLTHRNKKAVDACRLYAALIIAALHKYPKEKILAKNFYSEHQHWFGDEPLHDEVIKIAEGSFKKQRGYDDGIRGKGYIVNALEAALWAFWSDENSFKIGALNAVNLGDDTDTTAAIYGQLAGAYYGIDMIPTEWLEKLYARELIISMSEWIYFQGIQRQSNNDENLNSIISSGNNSNMNINNDESNNPKQSSKMNQTNNNNRVSSSNTTIEDSNISVNNNHDSSSTFRSYKKDEEYEEYRRLTEPNTFYPNNKKQYMNSD